MSEHESRRNSRARGVWGAAGLLGILSSGCAWLVTPDLSRLGLADDGGSDEPKLPADQMSVPPDEPSLDAAVEDVVVPDVTSDAPADVSIADTSPPEDRVAPSDAPTRDAPPAPDVPPIDRPATPDLPTTDLPSSDLPSSELPTLDLPIVPDLPPPIDGSEVLDASRCGPSLTVCASACVDLQSDPRHCGACGRACSGAQVCTAGSCGPANRCDPPLMVCDRACVSAASSAAHCGRCGHRCDPEERCAAGVCEAP